MRTLYLLAAFAAFALSAPVYAQDAPTGERHHVGLIIGNSRYTGTGLPPLPNACSDAQNVAASLVRIGWNEDTEIDLQCDLTVDQMSSHVRKFVEQIIDDPYAVAVFYFAGHGVQVDARQFIFGVDAKPNLKRAKWQIENNPDSQLFVGSALDVYADFIQEVGADTDGGLTVMIDACRSDPLINALNGPGVRRVTAPTVRTTLLPGILMALSTQNGEPAMDGGGAIGPYAAALKEAIARDKRVSTIMRDVSVNVWNVTRQLFPQHPQVPTTAGTLSFECLAGCVTAPAHPSPASPSSPSGQGPGFASNGEKPSTMFRHAALLQDASTGRSAPTLLRQAAQAAPAPTARLPSKLITPFFSQRALETMRQVKGLRVDIFWCEAGDDMDGRRAAAERYAEYLKARATERGEGQEIASVRLRMLTRTGNSIPSYRFVQNAVLSDPENQIATKWAGIMAETKDLLRANSANTGDYMSMFVCSIGGQTPFPAKVFWHVPDADRVGMARDLIGQLDEQAGNFTAMSDIEVIETGPSSTQIRYFYDGDQTVAFRLADSLQVLLGHEVQVKYFTAADVTNMPKQGTVEVWIGNAEPTDPALRAMLVTASATPSRNRTVKSDHN